MHRPLTLIAKLIVLGTVFVFAAAGSWSSYGPDASRTGAPAIGSMPAEFTCALCHFAEWDNVNTPGGAIEILDLPETYQPNGIYPIHIRLHSDSTATFPGHEWGFQITAIRASDGEGCGTFIVDPDSMHTIYGDTPLNSRQYAEHGHLGIWDEYEGPALWHLAWQAPGTPVGRVLFYCAGVAANDSHDPGGDLVFTTADSLDEQATPARQASWGQIKARYK